MSDILNVDVQSFDDEVLKAQGPVLVDVWAPWCGPCKMIAPILDSLVIDYEGIVKFVKVNADENEGICQSYGIRGIPTLMLFKDGVLVKQKAGAMGAQQIVKFIDESL